MKKLMTVMIATMIAVLVGCGMDTTGTTTEAFTTETTTPVSTTETTTTALPLDVAAIYAAVAARVDAIFAIVTSEPIEPVEGEYSREALFSAFVPFKERMTHGTRGTKPIADSAKTAIAEIGTAIASDLILEDGTTYRYREEYASESWGFTKDHVIRFSLDPEHAIVFLTYSTYYDSLGVVTGHGISGKRFGYDAIGRLVIDLFGISHDAEQPQGIGGYHYLRLHEGVEYFQLMNTLLCSGFGMIHESFETDRRIEIYATPESCDGEEVYGGTYGVRYRAAGENVETTVYVKEGLFDRFIVKFLEDGYQVLTVDMMDLSGPDSTWNATWNLHYASGWDSVRQVDTHQGALYVGDSLLIDEVHFLDTTGYVYFTMDAEAAAFTDDVLDLSAFGLAFFGAIVDNAVLQSYKDDAFAAVESRMVWDDVDLLDGNPWDGAKAFLPDWVVDLAAAAEFPES